MKVESFLYFWNTHNAVIIETLAACILVTALLYIAGRVFGGGGAGVDGSVKEAGRQVSSLSPSMTSEIEKTLNKILENQSAPSGPPGTNQGGLQTMASNNGVAGGGSAGTTSGSPGGGASNAADLAKLQSELEARESKVKILELQLSDLKSKPAAAAGGSVDQKVKDLETRLAEYEIISEDIADLSFYKEENARLHSEITNLKGAPDAGATPAPAAQPPPTEVAKVLPVETPAPIEQAPAAAAVEAPAVEPISAASVAVVETAPPQPAAEPAIAAAASAAEAASTAGDEDLMKQFAAAVAEQKGPENAAPQKVQADSELMGKFEEFVKKT